MTLIDRVLKEQKGIFEETFKVQDFINTVEKLLDQTVFAGNFKVELEKQIEDSDFAVGYICPKKPEMLKCFGSGGVKKILETIYWYISEETQTAENMFDLMWSYNVSYACLEFQIRVK